MRHIQPSFQSIVNVVRFPRSKEVALIYTDQIYCSSLISFDRSFEIRGILFQPEDILIVCPEEKITAKARPKKGVANIWVRLMDNPTQAYIEANRRAIERLKMDAKLIDFILFDEHTPYTHKQVIQSGMRERGPARISREYEVGNRISELAHFSSLEEVMANLGF